MSSYTDYLENIIYKLPELEALPTEAVLGDICKYRGKIYIFEDQWRTIEEYNRTRIQKDEETRRKREDDERRDDDSADFITPIVVASMLSDSSPAQAEPSFSGSGGDSGGAGATADYGGSDTGGGDTGGGDSGGGGGGE